MNDRLLSMLDELIAQTERYGGEDPDWTVPELELPAELADMLRLENDALALSNALRVLRAEVKQSAADLLRPGGKARMGNTLYRYSAPSPDRKPILGAIRRLVIDDTDPGYDTMSREAAQGWVSRAIDLLLEILPVGDPRVTAIDGIAKRRGVPGELLRATLIDETEKAPTLTDMPVTHHRAPKYAARMTDGEIIRGEEG